VNSFSLISSLYGLLVPLLTHRVGASQAPVVNERSLWYLYCVKTHGSKRHDDVAAPAG